jgi:hypothetical protein
MSTDHPYTLYLFDEKLVYKLVAGEIVWDVPIDTLILIAEYTTNEGPMRDDYFLVFGCCEHDQLFEMKCSFYALDAIATMETLLKKLNAGTTLGLASSTEWKSNIVWPPKLAGKPFFENVELVPKTFKARIYKSIFGPSFAFPPTPEVQAYLRGFVATTPKFEEL